MVLYSCFVVLVEAKCWVMVRVLAANGVSRVTPKFEHSVASMKIDAVRNRGIDVWK